MWHVRLTSPTFEILTSLMRVQVYLAYFWDANGLSRLWTVQEVALSSTATLFFGRYTFSFQNLLRAIEVSQKYKYADVLVELLPWFSMHLKFLGNFNYSSLGRRELPIEEKIASAELMESARYFQETKPHDKVYAMYGLLQERHIPLAKPDYYQTVSEVFCDLARAIIESSNSLEILYQVHGCGSTTDLPSWVPDWSGSTHPGRAPIGNCMGELYEVCSPSSAVGNI